MEAAKAAGVEGALAAQVWGCCFQRCTGFYASYDDEVAFANYSLRVLVKDISFISSKAFKAAPVEITLLESLDKVPVLLVPQWAVVHDGYRTNIPSE